MQHSVAGERQHNSGTEPNTTGTCGWKRIFLKAGLPWLKVLKITLWNDVLENRTDTLSQSWLHTHTGL